LVVDESHRGVASVVDVGFAAGGHREESSAAERAAGLGKEPGVDAVRVETVAAGREHLDLVAGHQRADADRALRASCGKKFFLEIGSLRSAIKEYINTKS
jgi:hypothetical protein